MHRYRDQYLPAFLLGALVLFQTVMPAEAEESSALRMPADTIGYATSPGEVEVVVAFADSIECERYRSNVAIFPKMAKGPMIGAICPHDDYLYAGHVYTHVMREVRAPVAILFGVSHTSRRRNIQGKLIFDRFEAWKGPYGNSRDSSLRESVIERLPKDLVLVSNEIHAEEHSLEAFIPFLQYYDIHSRRIDAINPDDRDRRHDTDRSDDGEGLDDAVGSGGDRRVEVVGSGDWRLGVEIFPILVPRLKGALFERAADTLAAVLSDEIRRRGWKLGTDVVILISADCVHYGDEKWGGRNYAPFGVGRGGYERGVAQDLEIVRSSLTGALTGDHVARFRERVERDDFQWPYKVTWCGVYSIPFGMSVMIRLRERDGGAAPEGFLLRYATSLDPGRFPVKGTGLGVTNINTLRHWVGYAAIGYW